MHEENDKTHKVARGPVACGSSLGGLTGPRPPRVGLACVGEFACVDGEFTEGLGNCDDVAKRWPDAHADIIGATPYSLRRGMISLRTRAGEDRRAIARQCGTSVEMLERSYSFAIEDLEDAGPRPAEEERLNARQHAVAGYRQLRVA